MYMHVLIASKFVTIIIAISIVRFLRHASTGLFLALIFAIQPGEFVDGWHPLRAPANSLRPNVVCVVHVGSWYLFASILT